MMRWSDIAIWCLATLVGIGMGLVLVRYMDGLTGTHPTACIPVATHRTLSI